MVDAKQRPVTLNQPGVLPVGITYDARGRVSSVTQGLRSQSNTYGPNGFLLSTSNALGETTRFTTDATGRVLSVKQPDLKDVLMSQDAVGNLTSFTPADRQAQTFSYTSADELASYALPPLPGTSAETTTYDLDGLSTGGTHGDASQTVVTREPSGRVTRVATPWWTNELSYTATTGQVQSLVRGTQRLEWTYDGFLMTQEKATGIAPATSQWTYDSDFRVASHSISGNAVAFSYESDSLPTQAGLATAAYAPTTGQLTSVTVGNVVTTRIYNGHGELSTLTTKVGGAPVYSEGLSYDNAGRITVIEDIVQGTAVQWTYGYDTLGRLTLASKNGGAPTTWTYDGSGNRLTENGVVATYDAQDRLLSSGATTYTWDALGSRQSMSDASGTTRYVHDGLGALLSVTMPDARVVSYQYDGRQRRVARRVNGVVTNRWVYDGQHRVVAQVDAAGVLVERYVYLSQSNSPDYLVRGANTFALVRNHLGSVRLVVDGAGAAVHRLDYDSWGNTQLDTAPGFQPFGFAGGLADATTKWVHFGYRDFDPFSAHWTGRDPIRFQLGYLQPGPLRLRSDKEDQPG